MKQKVALFTLFVFFVGFVTSLRQTRAFDSVAGSTIHQQITDSALSFLKEDIRNQIIDGNDFNFDFSERNKAYVHVDSCNFYGASIYIQEQYNAVFNSLEGGQEEAAANEFGHLLHPVQDFYAHTNWVELHKPNTTEIFMPGVLSWPTLEPFGQYSGVTVIENATAAQLTTLRRDGKVVYVNDEPVGLISGSVGTWGDCPEAPVGIGHYDIGLPDPKTGLNSNPYGLSFPIDGEPAYSYNKGTGMNKDNDSRTGFATAYALAVSQTTQEFCRLINLSARLDLDSAVKLFNSWVNDAEEAVTECSARGWSPELVEALMATDPAVPIIINEGIWSLETVCREDFTVSPRPSVKVEVSDDGAYIVITGLGDRYDGKLDATWDPDKEMYALGENTLVPEIPESGDIPGDPIGFYIYVTSETYMELTFGIGDCIHPWTLQWIHS